MLRVVATKKYTAMKKFICLLGLCLAMAMATYATPFPDTGQDKAQTLLLQADVQYMVSDFVIVSYDCNTIATEPLTEYYTIYEAQPMEVYSQVFDFEMPVFRLCIDRKSIFKSELYTGWRGINSNPPSQYDRA